jgi:hypothetical protein
MTIALAGIAFLVAAVVAVVHFVTGRGYTLDVNANGIQVRLEPGQRR